MIIRSQVQIGTLVLIFMVTATTLEGADLRDQYGTRSLEAARSFKKGLEHLEGKKMSQALAEFKSALAIDPTFELALFWRAITHGDLGDLDAAIKEYKKLVSNKRSPKGVTNIVVNGCINLALLYANIGKNTEASHWFTEAILLDPNNFHKLFWKAYRNMAISLHKRNKFLSAAMCAILAFNDNPKRVKLGILEEFLGKIQDSEEVGQVLHFPHKHAPVVARTTLGSLKPVSLLYSVKDKIVDLQLDIKGERVLGFGKNLRAYYLIETKTRPSIQKIKVSGIISAASVTAGELYLALSSPPTIAKVDIKTGKVIKKWSLPGSVPTSIAALPIQQVVCFPSNGVVNVLNLDEGSTKAHEFTSTAMRADPLQRFVYSYIHPGFQKNSGHILVNGRPVFFQSSRPDMAPTGLFKYAVANRSLLVCSFRLNAASNGKVLHISADGEWAAVVGGGGWRSPNAKGGYGVAIFRAHDISRLQGYFEVGAYPQGVAVNHISQHVAVYREKDGKLFHLSDPSKSISFKGSFGVASTWSTNGRYFFVAGKTTGLSCLELKRTLKEKTKASSWVVELEKQYPKPHAGRIKANIKGMSEFKTFQVRGGKQLVLAMVKKAMTQGRTIKPVDWLRYDPYFKTEADRKLLKECLKQVRSKEQAGFAVYRLKAFLKTHPDSPPATNLLGNAYYATNQMAKSEPNFIKAIHLDQGRTNVTIEALRALSYMKMRQNKHDQAAYCFAHVLLLDKANADWLESFNKFAVRAKIETQVRSLLAAAKKISLSKEETSPGAGSSSDQVIRKEPLPKLWVPRGAVKYSAERLFKKAAPSVVLIEAGRGTGSGVCVARRDIILTNYHVIEKSKGEIKVIPFSMKGGKPVRLPALKATIIFQSPADDIAVLKIKGALSKLKPLYVSGADPAPGSKVFAMGSPGLGGKVLVQSITEGIVSATARELKGKTFIQHTAAVNPGNSGGPLLNDKCHVIGLNTLKAKLENVSFAIPATRIRALFESK